MLSILARAATYATLFIGVVLVYLPGQLLAEAGINRPKELGAAQAAGVFLTTMGAAVALWCIATFAFVGRGTPAPFDPPRRLVSRGPYRYVRNPMYLGATIALGGGALFYESKALIGYAAGFVLLMHVFVVLYEEPTLRAAFGDDYKAYCRRVGRWLPKAVDTASRR
jgi:protein-S-isoprenylcysteine O-methyltransferase Ste14